jgi:AraC-like DNA-binding protein
VAERKKAGTRLLPPCPEKEKPTEIYLEVGFEDLSHFSFSFKKKYGIAPNKLNCSKHI